MLRAARDVLMTPSLLLYPALAARFKHSRRDIRRLFILKRARSEYWGAYYRGRQERDGRDMRIGIGFLPRGVVLGRDGRHRLHLRGGFWGTSFLSNGLHAGACY